MEPCDNCDMTLSRGFDEPPELLMFVIGENDVIIDHTVPYPGKFVHNIHLRRMIYPQGYHFTARIFDIYGKVWFHYGRTSGNTVARSGACIHQGQFADFDAKGLSVCRGRKAVNTCCVHQNMNKIGNYIKHELNSIISVLNRIFIVHQ